MTAGIVEEIGAQIEEGHSRSGGEGAKGIAEDMRLRRA